MKTHTKSLAAGESIVVGGGNSFHLISASFGIDVQYLKSDLTDINETARAVETGYYVFYEDEFALVKLTNGSTAQIVKFGVARGGKGGYASQVSEISGGDLDSIVNRRALNAKCYHGAHSRVASATNYSFIGVENPIGSGIQCAIKSIILTADIACLIKTGTYLGTTGGVQKNIFNNLIGTLPPFSPNVLLRSFINASTSVISSGVSFEDIKLEAGVPFKHLYIDPLIIKSDITQNVNYVYYTDTLNVNLNLEAQFEEF